MIVTRDYGTSLPYFYINVDPFDGMGFSAVHTWRELYVLVCAGGRLTHYKLKPPRWLIHFQRFKSKSKAVEHAIKEVETVISRANSVHTRLESLEKLGGNNDH